MGDERWEEAIVAFERFVDVVSETPSFRRASAGNTFTWTAMTMGLPAHVGG